MLARSIIMTILLWFCALPAFAGSIYLNGTRIDGVTNQKFDNVTVEIDAYGNVHITAKGYAVQGAKSSVNKNTADPQAQAGPVGQPPTRRYWVVTEKIPSKTQYDIDLFINGKWVRKFLDDEKHTVLEVTPHLKTGPNKLIFRAKKTIDGQRVSQSPQHYFRIVVGEGKVGGRNVMITRTLVDYRRTALETQDFSDEFVLSAQ